MKIIRLFFHKFILENNIVKMIQNRRLIFLPAIFVSMILFLSSCSLLQPQNPYVIKNTGNPMEPTRQINRAYPASRDANRYLDSNKKKKRKWTKIRQVYGFDCPWDKTYTSTADKKIKCKLRRTKAKLKRQTRRR
jgi:hypothetical protein